MLLHLTAVISGWLSRHIRHSGVAAESARRRTTFGKLRLVGVLLAVLILVTAGIAVWDLHRRTLNEASDDIRNLGGVLAEQTSRYVKSIDMVLQDAQLRSWALGIATPDQFRRDMGTEESGHFLRDRLQNLPEAHAIALFDADGAAILRTTGLPLTFSVRDRPSFQYLRDHADSGLLIREPALSRGQGRMTIFMSRRINGPDGGFLGVGEVAIDIDYLLGFYKAITHDGAFRVTLLRDDGVVLASYPPVASGIARVPAGSPWFAQLAAGGGAYRSPGNFRGVPSIVSVNPVGSFPLVINTSIAESTALAMWWEQARYTIGTAVLLAGSFIAIFLMSERQLRRQQVQNAILSRTADELRTSELQLRESEMRLERAQEIAGIGYWELSFASGEHAWSKNLRDSHEFPFSGDASLDARASRIPAGELQAKREWIADLRAGRQREPIEFRTTDPDGTVKTFRIEGRPVVDPDGTVHGLIATTQDVTRQRQIENQLAQSQKMEAIGALTGGMAHDFNNVLGVIIGNLDLLQRLIKADALAEEICGEARDGAVRCADLIRRLLAFARRQPLHPAKIDVNALVNETVHLLRRTIGEDIAVRVSLDVEVWPVTAGATQLEAALVNLATNARDAMPKGGELHIATRNAELDAGYAALHPDVVPGDYAVIEISDTGTGIPQDIINRVFEPFFTTKSPGQGTGLGLSMVFGFVKQSGGHISVYSEAGRGTTFRIYLPRGVAGAMAPAGPRDPGVSVGGTETVLVVEDNAQLRRSAVRQLVTLGYHVLEAEHADAARDMLEHGDRVDLLFTDVVMPGTMDGIDLAHRAMTLQPHIRVVVTSGFSGARVADQRVADCPFPFLAKPYRRDDLARVVRDVLDRDKGSAAITTFDRPKANAG